MKIKIKSEIKEPKSFNYILHTLQVREANILNWIKLHSLFSSPDSDIGRWESVMMELNGSGLVSFKNVKENSFDIEISDWDDCLLKPIKDFLLNNDLIYEI